MTSINSHETATGISSTKEETMSSIKNDDEIQENNTMPWDHTDRKVMVYNLSKYMKDKALKREIAKWTEGHPIEVTKIRKPHGSNWALLTLQSEDMVENFLKLINNGNYSNDKGDVLRADRSRGKDKYPNNKRPKDGDDDSTEQGHDKKQKTQNQEECVKTEDEVRDVVTPLWRLPYAEQLDVKSRNMIFKCLNKITVNMKGKFRELEREAKRNRDAKSPGPPYQWLQEKKPIEMTKILSAPKHVEYRNKCELTFGYSHQYNSSDTTTSTTSAPDDDKINTKPNILKIPAVGFMAGGWSGGVSEPHCLQNIPDVVCGIADIVNEFLRTSPIPPYNNRLHQGVWRSMTIRQSDRTKQCMIIICHAPSSGGAGKSDDGSDDYSLEFEKERDRLVNMLTQGTISKPKRSYREEDNDSDSGCDIRVTSIFFQEFDGLSNPGPQHPVQHVYGNKFIEEKLLQCTFQISPGAFFQVTTEGAENLYKLVVEKVREVTNNPKDTLLFDVCCGTGTIGLTCMKEGVVGKVIGIDIAEPAIKDAVDNAIRNGYSNEDSLTKFVASRAEAVMHDEIKNAGDNMHMVAVVDPAREGLHQDVLRAIRNEKKIQRLVYVSCNPTGSLIKDCTVLCCPPSKKYFGMPFKPTFAQPVDMFPLTSHCEMVMVFDRLTDEELNGDRQYKKQNVKNVGTNGQSEEGSTEKIDIEDGGHNTENKNNDGTDN